MEDKKEECLKENSKNKGKKKVYSTEESPFSSKLTRNKLPSSFDPEIKKERYKILAIYLYEPISKLQQLKDGRRIFNNRTIYTGFDSGYINHFLEFRQLLYENLLLNQELLPNNDESFTLESAVFSTFCYDPDFIEPLINRYKFKTLVIKDNSGKESVEKINEYLTFYHPKKDFTLKWGKFHSKLIILKFPNFLRVIIPSANLTGVDWYYLGQNFWFQDFNLKTEKKDCSREELEFEEYLELTLKYTLGKDFKNKQFFKNLGINLSDYDLTNTCVDLVTTISGKFVEEKLDFGIGRIKTLIEKYFKGKKENRNEKVIYQCSSIGSLKENFTNDFISAFLSKKDKRVTSEVLEIIFPSEEYVNSIEQGNELASCLFLGKEMFEKDFFPKKCFKVLELNDVNSIFKSNLIFHSKLILLLGKNNEVTEDSLFYFGSHNFSPSAWGNFQKQYTQLSSANYELGLIFNPRRLSLNQKKDIFNSLVIKISSKEFEKDQLLFMQNSNFFS